MYTKFRKFAYGISLVTKFRNSISHLKNLIYKNFQSWHGLCNKSSNVTNTALSLGATLTNEGMIMRTGKFENALALLGALIVVFAVSSAANTALADDVNLLDENLKIEASTTN